MTKVKKFELLLLIVKAVSGVAGSALILTENHPYITLLVLAAGAAANEALMYIKNNQITK